MYKSEDRNPRNPCPQPQACADRLRQARAGTGRHRQAQAGTSRHRQAQAGAQAGTGRSTGNRRLPVSCTVKYHSGKACPEPG